jgi:hypothetical protein
LGQEYSGLNNDETWEILECCLDLPEIPHPHCNPLNDTHIHDGGKKMMPIITIPEQKVDFVSMSPCERYVLTYAPMAKNPYVIWNF